MKRMPQTVASLVLPCLVLLGARVAEADPPKLLYLKINRAPFEPVSASADLRYVKRDQWYETMQASLRATFASDATRATERPLVWDTLWKRVERDFRDRQSQVEMELERRDGFWNAYDPNWNSVPNAYYLALAQRRIELAHKTLDFVEQTAPHPELRSELQTLGKEIERVAQKAHSSDGRALFARAVQLRRRILFAHPLLDFDQLLLTKRPPPALSAPGDNYYALNSGSGPGLVVLDQWMDDKPRELVLLEGKLPAGCAMHPDLSFDGKRVVFAYADHYFGNYPANPCRICQPRPIPGSHDIVATTAGHHTIHAGALILIDRQIAEDGLQAITRLTPESTFPESEPDSAVSFSTPYPLANASLGSDGAPAPVAAGAQEAAGVQEAADEQELAPQPPTHYMGREIATTMHFTGAPWLVRESRQRQEDCERLLKELAVKPGQMICDMGCGNGFYTLKLAQLTGEQGKVYAVDIQQQMLNFLRRRARSNNIENIVYLHSTEADPRLPDNTLDLVLMVDVYHEFSYPEKMLHAVCKSLKPEGRIALAEFRAEDPDVPIKPLHKMTKRQILKEFAANGLKLVSQFDALPWQHLMFFSKK